VGYSHTFKQYKQTDWWFVWVSYNLHHIQLLNM